MFKVLSVNVDRSDGLSIYMTMWNQALEELALVEYDTGTLAESIYQSLGDCTEAELDAETYAAWCLSDSDGNLIVYGRMNSPAGLIGVHHIINYNGTSWSAVENGWGTDICGSVFLDGFSTFAVRNLDGGGARLYIEGESEMELVSTSSLNTAVGPHGMTIGYTDGTILLASREGDAVMVVGSPSPYATWYDLTSDHGTDDGVNAIEVL